MITVLYILMVFVVDEPKPIVPAILHTQAECEKLGQNLVDIVLATVPERGKKMTWQCKAVPEAKQ